MQEEDDVGEDDERDLFEERSLQGPDGVCDQLGPIVEGHEPHP